MQRRTFITGVGATGAAALAGCLSSTEEPSNDIGSVDEDAAATTIEVSGTGTVAAEPDLVRMRVSVEANGDDAEEVRTELAERAPAVRDALIDAGIDEDDITTSRYDIGEQRQGPGFDGTHRYQVEIDEVDEAGRMIDVAVEAGADDVGRIQFTLADDTRDDLRDVALERAIDDARDDAETIAATKSLELIGTVSVSTGSPSVSPMRVSFEALDTDDAGDAPPTDLSDGEVSVSATVSVVYAAE